MAFDQAARMINVLGPTAAGAAEQQVKKRQRKINFPDLHPDDPAVRDRVLSLIRTAAPEALQSVQAGATAAAGAADAAGVRCAVLFGKGGWGSTRGGAVGFGVIGCCVACMCILQSVITYCLTAAQGPAEDVHGSGCACNRARIVKVLAAAQ